MPEFRTLSDLGFGDSDGEINRDLLGRVAIAHGECLEELVDPFDTALSDISSNLNDLCATGLDVPRDIFTDFVTLPHTPGDLSELLSNTSQIDVDSVSFDTDMPTSQNYSTAHCEKDDAPMILERLNQISECLTDYIDNSADIAQHIDEHHEQQDEVTRRRIEKQHAIGRAEEKAREGLRHSKHQAELNKLALEIVLELKRGLSLDIRNFHSSFGTPLVLLADFRQSDLLEEDVAKFLSDADINLEIIRTVKLRPDTMTRQSYHRYRKQDPITNSYYTDWLEAFRNGDVRIDEPAKESIVNELLK